MSISAGVFIMKKQLLNSTSKGKSSLPFFLLTFVISIPFWLVGTVTGLQVLPGVPVSSLMVVSPVMAASILLFQESKIAGISELLRRSFDYKRIRAKVWYAPIVLMVPGAMVLTYGLMRWVGSPVPTPQISVLVVLVMSLVFFIAALGEELGWMGYAIDLMQDRWNAVQASILLGLVWATWHFVPLVQAGRSLAWIAWWCLFTVASRVLIVWLYNNTGKSIFATAIYHASSNVSTVLFADYFDPRITGLILAFAALIVVFLWGSKTLARYRYARSGGRLSREEQKRITNG
jgi:membrane protease YdiL (CAAX protease family)